MVIKKLYPTQNKTMEIIKMKLEQFFTERGSAKSTKDHYLAAVKQYSQLNEMTLDQLIEEADQEEENGVRWKNRKIKERLIAFRKYLYDYKSEGTAKLYLNDIKTIYRHFEIEVQSLPRFNSHQIDKTYEMSYEDILTRDELIDAYYEANNVGKCIMLFAMSSGFSRVDMLNLSVYDFMVACKDSYHSDVLVEQLKELKEEDCLIPTFRDDRQKTSKKFTTFCSPEAAEHIIQYLIGRDAKIKMKYEEADEEEQEDLPSELDICDKLFDISESHLSYSFSVINSKLELGTAGKNTRFRCHMLRKYHATTLLNLSEIDWTMQEIDTLQGRSQDKTHRAYFHNNTDSLKEKYIASVDELMLFKSIHGVDEEAFAKVKAENNFFKKEIVKNERKLEEQQDTIDKIIANQRELEALLGL